VFWTGEGKLCSWHMMSGSTHILSEKMNLIEKDNNGGIIKQYDVVLTDYLNYKQIRTLGKWPFLVPDFIAYIKDQALKEGMNNIEIYTDIMVSRNKGEYRHIINPMKNMCKTTRKYTGHNEWVLLYKEEGF
jgi:hypothetical protein